MPTVDYTNTFQKFEHPGTSFPNGSLFILSDITRFKYQVKIDLMEGETALNGLRVVIRYGSYSYTGGVPTQIAATFDFAYTGGNKIIDLGIVPSAWGYFNSDINDNIITVSFYVRVTDGSGTYYTEMLIFQPKINYYQGPSPERFNVSRDLTMETTANFDLKLIANSIKQWQNVAEFNTLEYKRQYHNGITWIDIEAYQPVTGLTYENILSHNLPYLADLSYNVRIALKDKVKEVFYSDLLTTASVPLSLGKTGIGVGKIWEHGVLDIFGEFYKNNILQPTIFQKKITDPDPGSDSVEEGDLLVVYQDVEPFASSNFPQEFGTGYTWSQIGTWPNSYAYWTGASAISNTIIESFEASALKGSGYPSLMFNGNSDWNNGYGAPVEAAPISILLRFKGLIKFNSFTLRGWQQGHELGSSPKSFVMFGSKDGHTWVNLYDTTNFPDTASAPASAAMQNSGEYFEYLKIVLRENQNGNDPNTPQIFISELYFDAEGYKYV